jgi:sugar O-acyltransferase (sialic acid O-acetyltransferase NeuD family)
MLKDLILWGAAGHAKVLREFVGRCGYRLVAVFDNDPCARPPFPDVPLYCGAQGFRDWHQRRAGKPTWGLVAIGGASGRDRLQFQQMFRAHGVQPAVAVHPTAFVAADAVLSVGCQVLAQAAVCAAAVLGDACIINTAATVDHECVLGKGVHLAPGAVLAGCIAVGDFTLIGPRAVVLPRIKVGRDAIIGAGAVVTRDVPDGKVVYGVPARVQRENQAALRHHAA